jgi:hypothetical protein
MSLRQSVIDLVNEMGSADCDELHEKLEGYTRQQVMNALKNARREGQVHCFGHARAFIGGGSEPARHYPGPKPMPGAKGPGRGKPPPASVWDLAGFPMRNWPPRGEGRVFNLLGPWDAA